MGNLETGITTSEINDANMPDSHNDSFGYTYRVLKVFFVIISYFY